MGRGASVAAGAEPCRALTPESVILRDLNPPAFVRLRSPTPVSTWRRQRRETDWAPCTATARTPFLGAGVAPAVQGYAAQASPRRKKRSGNAEALNTCSS
ncbi:hypothetical protein MRX96_046477 [Rhipicephalus microplus]